MEWYVERVYTAANERETAVDPLSWALHYLGQCGERRRQLSSHVFGYTKGDATVWKNEPLEHSRWMPR